VDEDVWQSILADLTLELVPIYTGVMSLNLPILLGLEPALKTNIVNEFNTTSALANLN
jgi:hypothetical protein